MKTLLLVVVTLGAAATFVLAQTATPNQSLAWAHPTASAELVTHFEVKYDGGVYANVGKVAVPNMANYFYAPLPPLATGTHVAAVRPCNVVGCAADAVFNFTMVAGVPTVIQPGSVLIIQTPQ